MNPEIPIAWESRMQMTAKVSGCICLVIKLQSQPDQSKTLDHSQTHHKRQAFHVSLMVIVKVFLINYTMGKKQS
jgi:hypothetical protein